MHNIDTLIQSRPAHDSMHEPSIGRTIIKEVIAQSVNGEGECGEIQEDRCPEHFALLTLCIIMADTYG